jgi:hypothetical protein
MSVVSRGVSMRLFAIGGAGGAVGDARTFGTDALRIHVAIATIAKMIIAAVAIIHAGF